MYDIDVKHKIDALIASQQAHNNFIALSLMQSQLQMDFNTAFRQLHFKSKQASIISGSHFYEIQILNFCISFELEHCWATCKEYPFLQITRNVHSAQEIIQELKRCFTIDFFEKEDERSMFEAMQSVPELGEGLHPYLF